MLQFIISNTMFWKGMLVCFVFGLLCQIIANLNYLSMLKVTQEIGRTRKHWILTLKKKYQNYGKLGVQVQDIDSFVGRQVQKQKFFVFRLNTWEMIADEMKYLCVFLGGYGAIYSMYIGGAGRSQYITLSMGCFAAGILAGVKIFCQIPEKQKEILYNIKDYLENVLKNHLYSDDADNFYGRRSRGSHEERLSEVATARVRSGDSRTRNKVTREEEKLVEEVLKDYFES